MQVEKRINNNVILATENGQQMVLIGSGLGFKAYPGDSVKQSKIEKKFFPADGFTFAHMSELVSSADPKELKSVYKMLKLAKEEFPTINDTVLFTILDHLSFCLKRIRQNMPIVNPLEWEVRKFYPKEYQLGRRFLEIITLEMSVTLPETEAAFFALHLVNAQISPITGNEVFELTELTNAIVKIVKYYFKCEFDEESCYYNRFITHVRYYLMRQMRQENAPETDSFLVETVNKSYPDVYSCVSMITKYLYDKRGFISSEAEKMYLILHIAVLVKKKGK